MAVADRSMTFWTRPPLSAVYLAVAAGCVIVLFWDAIGNLWSRWGEQQELSHSYFIPVVSAWLVWVNRDAVKASVGEGSWAGLAFAACAGFLFFVGHLTQAFVFQQIGLIAAIAGLVAGFGGLSLLRATAAPIAFLLLAVPPPYWAITVLSWKFQLISSAIGVWMIQLMGIPVYLSGNVIDLGTYQLQVAEACSGLRYLFPFLSLGVMTAYIYRGPLWHKAAIILSTIPITIIMNSFRVAVTGALVQASGPQHAEGALHFFEGWVVFVLCLLALFGVIALLGLFTKPRRGPLDALGTPALPQVPPSERGTPRLATLGGTAALMLGVLGLAQVVTVDQFLTPARKDFAGVPAEFPDWRHEVRPIDAEIADVLGADDSIVVDLLSPDGDNVNLYFAYLEARRDGRTWHSPRQCIPGGGWRITSHDVLSRDLPDGHTLNYNRLIIENRGQRQLVYYWYDQRGRKIANEFVMKLWLIFDAVARKRSDGAMLRLMTPVRDDGGIAAAEAELDAMTDRIHAFLPAYVPE